MRALIVGGGIGGLASAIGLCRASWQVTVREQAEGLTGVGTGLGIWPEAVRALDRLGLGDVLRQQAWRQAIGFIRRPAGRRVATIDTDKIEQRTGEPVYLVSRPALLSMLHAAVPAGVVRFSAGVTDPSTVLADYDVVIGADGINSLTRRALFGPEYGLRYTGVTAWRGVVDLDLDAGGETWDRGRKFGFTPLGPGQANWYAAARVPEGYQPSAGDLAELTRHYGRWHDPIPRIVERVKPDAILRHPLHYLDPPLPSYVKANAALLGDAAHAMPPDLGQGACQALIDGLILSECLVAAPDVRSGLSEYDRRRRKRSQRLAAMALRVSRMSLATRLTGLRDLTTRIALTATSPGG
jgi:2-polyprenyl-6-methoxyphenol hydroxylase-like FAD-dependent oxidoreductase